MSGWGQPAGPDARRADDNCAFIRALLARKQPAFAAALEAAVDGDPRLLIRQCVADGTIHTIAPRILAVLVPDLAKVTDNLLVIAVPERVRFTARQLRPGWTRRSDLTDLATVTVPLAN